MAGVFAPFLGTIFLANCIIHETRNVFQSLLHVNAVLTSKKVTSI